MKWSQMEIGKGISTVLRIFDFCVRLTWLASSLFSKLLHLVLSLCFRWFFFILGYRLNEKNRFSNLFCSFFVFCWIFYLWSILGQQVVNTLMTLHECRNSDHTCEHKKKRIERIETVFSFRLSSQLKYKGGNEQKKKDKQRNEYKREKKKRKYKIAITNVATELNRFDYRRVRNVFCFWMKHMWRVKLPFLFLLGIFSYSFCSLQQLVHRVDIVLFKYVNNNRLVKTECDHFLSPFIHLVDFFFFIRIRSFYSTLSIQIVNVHLVDRKRMHKQIKWRDQR